MTLDMVFLKKLKLESTKRFRLLFGQLMKRIWQGDWDIHVQSVLRELVRDHIEYGIYSIRSRRKSDNG